MGIFTHRVVLRSLCAAAALFAVATVQAQNINVASANSSNGYVFKLNFFGPGPNSATTENTDHTSYSSIQSVALLPNASNSTLDLLVADNKAGKIAVFSGWPPTTPAAGTVIWTAAQGGPASPDGLTADGAGNLFVVNASKTTPPQLWVFPAAGPAGCNTTPATTPLPNYPALCTPVRIDSNFARGQQLVETTIVPGGVVNAGDLLLLTNSPATVLDYHFPTAGNFSTFTRGSPLITLPAGTTTGGLAFWPLGAPQPGNPLGYTLLITNQTAATILRYVWKSAPSPATFGDFYDGLGGNGHVLYKIKTGYQNGVPNAFVAESGSVSFINQFQEGNGGPTGTAKLVGTLDIHAGINHPEGLAVANAAAAAANACAQTAGGCNPTGLLSHSVPQNTSPALVESVCVVPIDPRVTYQGNNWSCSGAQLPVNNVCPGFDTTGGNMFIPGYMCGMSGDNGGALHGPAGFTLIKTLTSAAGFNNTIVDNVSNNLANDPVCLQLNNTFPSNNPPFTIATLLWGPVLGEGSFLADGVTNETLELTDGCGSVHGGTSGNSIWGEGLVINTAFLNPNPSTALAALVDNKYGDLKTTIQSPAYLAGNITGGVGPLLSSGGTSGCVPLSQIYFDFAQFEAGTQQTQDLKIAADLLSNADTSATPITCDSIVTANPGNFTQNPDGITPPFNPSGQVRSRLANLYFTINSRILGNPPNTGAGEPPAWPPTGAQAVAPPPSGFTECAGEVPASGRYPPPGGCPTISVNPTGVVEGGNVTVSWKLFGSTPCTLNSGGGDSTFTGAQVAGSTPPNNANLQGVTATNSPGTYTYTLACTGPEPATTTTVTTQLTVWAPVAMNVNPSPINGGDSTQVSWTPPAGATACNLSKDGQGSFISGPTNVPGPTDGTTAYQTTYQSIVGDNPVVNFAVNCGAGASPGTAQLSVN